MKHYKVESPLLHDGTRYAPGDTVEMAEDAAEPLVERGRLGGPVKPPAKGNGGKAAGGSNAPAKPSA